ncbi:MAG: ribonuclease H, partial [Flavobacteriaceae bacterium]
PGGYGIIIEWVGKGYIKEFSRGFKYTTNNRMELWAVIDALEKLKKKPMDVLIISDSKYVIEAIEKKWVFGWQKKNFKGKKNPDLWKRFLKIYPQHNVQFQWVKGHNNHPQNERCDQLAVTAAKDMAIEQDIYYEQLKQKA